MVKYSFVFLIVFAIGILAVLLKDVAVSVVPGWHTTIYPPWFLATVGEVLWLGLVSGIYYFIERKGITVTGRIFLWHIFLSLFLFTSDNYLVFDNYYAVRIAMLTPHFLFLLGQLVFVIGVLFPARSL